MSKSTASRATTPRIDVSTELPRLAGEISSMFVRSTADSIDATLGILTDTHNRQVTTLSEMTGRILAANNVWLRHSVDLSNKLVTDGMQGIDYPGKSEFEAANASMRNWMHHSIEFMTASMGLSQSRS